MKPKVIELADPKAPPTIRVARRTSPACSKRGPRSTRQRPRRPPCEARRPIPWWGWWGMGRPRRANRSRASLPFCTRPSMLIAAMIKMKKGMKKRLSAAGASAAAEVQVFYAVDEPVGSLAEDGLYDAPIVGISFGYGGKLRLLTRGTREQLVGRLEQLMKQLPAGVVSAISHNAVGSDETLEGFESGMASALQDAFVENVSAPGGSA
jgi:hypothetical protein